MTQGYYFDIDIGSKSQELHLISKETLSFIGYYLIKSDRYIKYVDFFSKDSFLVLLNDSSIYIAKVGDEKLSLVVQGASPTGQGYWIDTQKKEFWLATTVKGDIECLQHWDLDKKELIDQIELPEYINTRSLTRRKDGCFVFYNHLISSLEELDEDHGFYCTNPSTKTTTYHKLDSKFVAGFTDLLRNSMFAHEKDIAVIPAVEEYISSKGEDGETLYEYQVQLIDLNDFSVRWKKTLNRFSVKDLFWYEDEMMYEEKREEFDRLVSGELDSDLDDAAEEWIEFLDRTILCEDEDAFWLIWQNSEVCKVDFNGNILVSPYSLEYKEDKSISILDRDLRANKEYLMLVYNDYVYVDLLNDPKVVIDCNAPKLTKSEEYIQMKKANNEKNEGKALSNLIPL